jgi:Domain of Unknown Function (DUF350)
MELIGLKLGAIVGSVVFALIGVLIFWLCFVIVDKLTPYDFWHRRGGGEFGDLYHCGRGHSWLMLVESSQGQPA